MNFSLHLKKGSFSTLLKSYTKHFLILVTSAMTFGAIGLIRMMLGGSDFWSPVARAIYWAATSYFGFCILVYPWWLATSKSPFYYGRLRYWVIILSVIGFVLNIWRSLLAPLNDFDRRAKRVPTTITYRVVSLLWWFVCLVGFTIILAFLVRRSKIFKNKSLTLYTFVIPFVIIMFGGTVIQEWTSYNFGVVYSPVILLVLPLLVIYIDGKVNPENNADFNEIYIIIAGKLTYATGNAMLCCAMLCYAMLCYAMLCYAMLCYAMLCYVVLCYVVLCYAMLCYAMLCCAMLCCAMLCYAMLCYAMLCCAMLCYAMLCYVVLCYAMLCYVMLCYAMLCCIVSMLRCVLFMYYMCSFAAVVSW
jgi:hypothetical protein